MKIARFILGVTIACVCEAGALFAKTSMARDSTGLPGDNFSLEGALEMFKKAESPEQFEKMINTEDNKVNNLDLNGDGDIDYIKVIDKGEDGAHAFILQAAVSDNESQDIAVIELEKTGSKDAIVQIVGDEDIYGEQIIVEPADENRTTVAPAQTRSRSTSTTNVVVNVWTWPVVRHVYAPGYVVWVSPWGWRARPVWWRPWRPVHYHVFYPYRAPYHRHYVVVHHHRVVHAHRIYTPVRTTSVTVHTRNRASVDHYRTTRTSRSTTVTRERDNKQTKVTRRTTTVQGKHGKATKRTTRVRRKD
jgi:hypothetical protein